MDIQNLTGGDSADTLTGDAHDNILSGGAGADLFIGGGGADYFVGGGSLRDPNGTVSYADATSAVTIDFANLASNTGEAEGDTYYAVEYFIGTAYDDTFNSITSTAWNTALRGGAGDDSYYVDGDSAIENAGEGIDTVYNTAATYTLGANVENLTYIGSGAFTGNGNALANVIVGGNGNDAIVDATIWLSGNKTVTSGDFTM